MSSVRDVCVSFLPFTPSKKMHDTFCAYLREHQVGKLHVLQRLGEQRLARLRRGQGQAQQQVGGGGEEGLGGLLVEEAVDGGLEALQGLPGQGRGGGGR